MSQLLAVIAVVFATAVAPAAAQQGNGAYEPFPSPAPSGTARAYLELLGVRATPRDLTSGRFLDGLNPASRPAAGERAGLGVGGSTGWIVVLVAAGVLLVVRGVARD
ncbi:hypothetical protein [Paraconexibacter sp.]|uniref:hypothetical protein n=1 Tax=Paraconexibacter sp. TaxID=2949640 RepID=UPI00356A4F31